MRLPIVHSLILTTALSLSGPWKRVAPGVETAPAAELGGDPAWAARVVVADPAKARLLVRYDASRPTLVLPSSEQERPSFPKPLLRGWFQPWPTLFLQWRGRSILLEPAILPGRSSLPPGKGMRKKER